MQLAFTRSTTLSAEDEFPAAEAFTDEVIGQPFEDELHSRHSEGAKGLAGDALKIERQGRGQHIEPARDQLPSQARAEGTIGIGNASAERKRYAGGAGGNCRFDPLVIDGGMVVRAAVALPCQQTGPEKTGATRALRSRPPVERT